MRNFLSVVIALVGIFCGSSQYVYGCTKVVVKQSDDLVKVFAGKNTKYIIKDYIDLGGKKVTIGGESELVFKGGSLSNGTIFGNDTRLKPIDRNIFNNCTILGTWKVKYSISSMFDKNMETITLLKNLSCLSRTVRLKSDREYFIFANDDEMVADVIEASDKERPTIRFHTENPNVPGINIIGDNITLRNLIIYDDYSVSNDVKYGPNNNLIGNTVTIKAKNQTVECLLIEGCDFCGGTSSSFVASSQVQSCTVKNCKFSGYMADHGVYCSMKAEQFVVDDCIINDVTHSIGLFKVRSSKNLKLFKLKNLSVHNFNGYLVAVGLMSTPYTRLAFENIVVTKDESNSSIFYGFNISDATDCGTETNYNAQEIVFSNCWFDYGYHSNALIYPGAGKNPNIKKIRYNNVYAKESNFGGGIVEELFVNKSVFEDFCSDKGLSLNAKRIVIQSTRLSCDKKKKYNCVFLLNNSEEIINSATFKDVKVELNAPYFIKVVKGDKMSLSLLNCEFFNPYRSIVYRPRQFLIDYTLRKNSMQYEKEMVIESVF